MVGFGAEVVPDVFANGEAFFESGGGGRPESWGVGVEVMMVRLLLVQREVGAKLIIMQLAERQA